MYIKIYIVLSLSLFFILFLLFFLDLTSLFFFLHRFFLFGHNFSFSNLSFLISFIIATHRITSIFSILLKYISHLLSSILLSYNLPTMTHILNQFNQCFIHFLHCSHRQMNHLYMLFRVLFIKNRKVINFILEFLPNIRVDLSHTISICIALFF